VGNWTRVVDQGWIQVELPQRWGRPAEGGGGNLGAPPLEKRDPKRLLYAAWLKDCGGDTYLELARELRFPLDDLPGAEQAAKRKAIKYTARGRSLACILGIWPWASWPAGKPPRADWWRDDRCRKWLRSWLAGAQGQALLETNEAAQRSLMESQQLIATALERQLLQAEEISDRFRKSLLASVSPPKD
jgi:hypothetical protein